MSAADPGGVYDWFSQPSPSSYDAGSGTKVAPLGVYEWFTQAMNNSQVAPTGLYPWLDERTAQVLGDWSSWSTAVQMPVELVWRFVEWFKEAAQWVWAEIQRLAGIGVEAVTGGNVGKQKVTREFVDHLVLFEGLKLQPYNRLEKGSTHLFAIGYGHNIVPGRDDWMMKGITVEQAKQIKQQDLAYFEGVVNRQIKRAANQVEFETLVGCCYGLGTTGQSKIMQLWNSGDKAALCLQISKNVGVGRAPSNPQGNLWERSGMYIDAIQNSATFRWPVSHADLESRKQYWRSLQKATAGY